MTGEFRAGEGRQAPHSTFPSVFIRRSCWEIILPKRALKRVQHKIPTEVRASYACHQQLEMIDVLLRDMPAIRVSKSLSSEKRALQRKIKSLIESLSKDLDGYIKL